MPSLWWSTPTVGHPHQWKVCRPYNFVFVMSIVMIVRYGISFTLIVWQGITGHANFFFTPVQACNTSAYCDVTTFSQLSKTEDRNHSWISVFWRLFMHHYSSFIVGRISPKWVSFFIFQVLLSISNIKNVSRPLTYCGKDEAVITTEYWCSK
jgi:hypothetical protein